MDFLFGPVIRSKTNEKSTLEDSYHHSQDLVLSWLILRYFITESVCSSTSVQKLNGFTIFKSLFSQALKRPRESFSTTAHLPPGTECT